MKVQSVPRSEHTCSIIKTNQLLQYGGNTAVCSEICTKHENGECGILIVTVCGA
jgi:hypothetical protein